MRPTRWTRRYLLVFGGVWFLVSLAPLAAFYFERKDIWWTPSGMKVPAAGISDRVEVYLRDVPLGKAVQEGRLRYTATEPVPIGDFSFRFNNFERVAYRRMPFLLASSFCAGFCGLLFLLGLLGLVPARPEA